VPDERRDRVAAGRDNRTDGSEFPGSARRTLNRRSPREDGPGRPVARRWRRLGRLRNPTVLFPSEEHVSQPNVLDIRM